MIEIHLAEKYLLGMRIVSVVLTVIFSLQINAISLGLALITLSKCLKCFKEETVSVSADFNAILNIIS